MSKEKYRCEYFDFCFPQRINSALSALHQTDFGCFISDRLSQVMSTVLIGVKPSYNKFDWSLATVQLQMGNPKEKNTYRASFVMVNLWHVFCNLSLIVATYSYNLRDSHALISSIASEHDYELYCRIWTLNTSDKVSIGALLLLRLHATTKHLMLLNTATTHNATHNSFTFRFLFKATVAPVIGELAEN